MWVSISACTLWSATNTSADVPSYDRGSLVLSKYTVCANWASMQASFANFPRVHAACALSPLRTSSSVWAVTRKAAANRGVRQGLHTVQAAEQNAAGSEPSKVDVKGQLF